MGPSRMKGPLGGGDFSLLRRYQMGLVRFVLGKVESRYNTCGDER
jgi:hypothetical protein